MVRDYSQVSDSLYPLLYGPIWYPRFLQHAIKLATELARVRTNLIIWYLTIIYGLTLQGVELPHDPSIRSDPSQVIGGRRTPPTP